MANERRNAHAQTFRIPEGDLEVVTIYVWPPMRPADEIRFSATYPSRRLEPVTSELLQQYAAAWAEAAQWMAGMLQMPLIVDAAQAPDQECGFCGGERPAKPVELTVFRCEMCKSWGN